MSKPVKNWCLNVEELKRHLRRSMGFNRFTAELMVLAFIEEIIEALERGGEVDLGPEFGKFYPLSLADRKVDPKFMRGETDTVPAYIRIVFSPGKRLNERVADSVPRPYQSDGLYGTKDKG